MEWIYLLLAIFFELAGTISLKVSHGYTKFWPSVLVVAFYVPAFVMLGWATKAIAISTAYAIWSGLGTAFMAIVGIAFFGEAAVPMKIVGLVLVIAGVVMLNLSGGH